jgi:hypothetical protein
MAATGSDPLAAGGLAPPIRTRVPGKALLGMEDARCAGVFARALEDVGLIPTLAFTAPQVLAVLDADGFDLVVVEVELAVGRPEPFLRAVHARTDAALLAVGGDRLPFERLFGAGIHGQVPSDTPAKETAIRGVSLLGLRQLPEAEGVLHCGDLELDVGLRQARWGRQRSAWFA